MDIRDELAGTNTYCYRCRHLIKVPAASVSPAQADDAPLATTTASEPESFTADNWRAKVTYGDEVTPLPRPATLAPYRQPSLRHFKEILAAIALFGLGIVAIYLFVDHYLIVRVWTWIDNGGSETITVSVDDKEVAVIDPGKFQKVQIEPGDHRIVVRCGDKVVFDKVKALSSRLDKSRRFLLNPDGNHRYLQYSAHYEVVKSKGSFWNKEQGKKKKEDLEKDQQDMIRRAHQQLVNELHLMPGDTWFEFDKVDHVLTKPPWFTRASRSADETTRTALARVTSDEHALIRAALENQDPTEDDVIVLIQIVDRVMARGY
jgi:hypothetical protein